MELIVDRLWKQNTYTIGKFFIDDTFFSNTMEDRDRGLLQEMPLSKIKSVKVYGETAIPRGRYEVKMTYSQKFSNRAWARPDMGFVPEILDVPGFSGIRIHPLNSAEDSLGCIGLGKNDKKGWISNSTKYYREFVDKYLTPAIERGEKVFITVR